ncbi:Smg8/Smg9, partial [Cynara cardunculus var. scolymus]
MAAPNRSPMRVLIRPPSSSSPITPPSATTVPPPPPPTIHQPPPPSSLPPLPPPPSTTFRQNGVVVVGFVGRRKGDVSQLINRIIDANVFGSGNADVALGFEKTGEIVSDEVKNWFEQRRISYYHEEAKGVLYLQFCSTKCTVMEGFSEVPSGFDSVFEKQEFGDLQGMLFMFSEGSCFDIQMLKKFRVLQGAKYAMFPFIKSQTLQPTTSRSHTSPSSRTSPSGGPSKNRSPGKNGPAMSRNASSITLMSGLGSHTSFFPGQCTPVILFVFLDDIFDPGSNPDEPAESTSSYQSSSLNSLGRPTLPVKGSGSIVVLSRPVTKSEGSFKKKLQSSLEAQIRFSIKKCRVLSGSETGPPGSRSGAVSSLAPLFSLDASKAVLLLDRLSNQAGESLEFATSIVENVLNGISTSDSLLLENHSQSSNKEDILSVKEFIYRQCDILRGRGNMVSNANSVSAAGVGMVAVAAAAAAASVASGKPCATPELPNLDVWLSSSQTILYGLLSAKPGFLPEPEPEQSKRRSKRNNVSPTVEGSPSKVSDPLELAATYLDSSRGLNTKFSISWCQRALPVAKDVYLNDLPACYPTSQHEAHLGKALSFFKSMVKGPAVHHYLKKLEDECTSIWISGRQLCDAVSLTGKSCIHQRHDLKTEDSLSSNDIKPHSSGFVFLHACACGRSRKLRSDPFDFETANVTFSCYPECDKLLPTLHLPQVNSDGPIQSSSWSLIRIGGSRYYQPSKGLLQSGFSSTEKFLLKWKFFLEKHKEPTSILHGYSMNESSNDSRVEGVLDAKVEKEGLAPGELHNGVEMHGKTNNSDDNKSNSVKVLPSFTMKKPFSEVVAGSAATSSGFPPLQSKKKASENVTKEKHAGETSMVKVHDTNGNQGSKKVENISSVHETVDGNGNANGNPFLKLGSTGNIVTMNSRENTNLRALNQVLVYIGFEHECPCGHRFILTPDHLKGLGSIYAVDEESHYHSSVESSDRKGVDLSKMGKHGGHGKVHRHSNRMVNAAVSKVRHPGKLKEVAANGKQGLDAMLHVSRSRKEQNGLMKSDYMKDIEGSLQSTTLDDNGTGVFPLLDRNLPLYLNCPHCQIHKSKSDPPNVQFAGTISQLQRIFLVTPPFPTVLAACPVIQFEMSCLPPSVPEREQKLQFSLGCPVVLPPESFLSLRLPFVYGVQLEDGSLHPLKPFENQPEMTAWITKSTALQFLSKGSSNLEV